tara:strand:+ start:93 stop:350 length:258 start_codon:yes stop_codon:yes gene_type:complete
MDEKQLITENGIFIIKPSNYKISISDCSICGFALRHKEDTIEQKRVGCCLDCSLYFYQPNRIAWENGWRPTKEEVKKVITNQIGE